METNKTSEKQWEKFNSKVKVCPTKFAIKLFKKWSFEIIRDIWFGNQRFSEILKGNPGLSTKVLSQRLRELEQYGVIEKIIISKTPLRAIYQLTDKGQALNKILYDLAMFSYDFYVKELFEGDPPKRIDMINVTSRIFKISQS